MHSIDLGSGVTFVIDPERRECETRYGDGFSMAATRPDTPENRAEAADQGYPATEAGVWQSLQDHELLHTLLTRRILASESLVLRHESGAERARYALRLHEESLVLSAQRWINTGKLDPVLFPHVSALKAVASRVRDLVAPVVAWAA